jgi:hypothetical protein
VNVALFVTAIDSCSEAQVEPYEVLLGTIGKAGLNSEANQGYSAPYGDLWYATKGAETTSSGRPRVSRFVNPVGTYDIFSSNGGRGAITFDFNPDKFTTSYGDSGIWVSKGNTLAFGVTKTTDGDDGCLYLGTLHGKLINSKHQKGPTLCNSGPDTWYAQKAPA